jgi:hypothetical protein
MVSADLSSLERFLERIQNADQEFPQDMALSVMAVGQNVVNRMEQYPPETEANQPPPPYYIRGTGKVLVSGRILPTSRQLGSNWEQETRIGAKEVEHRVFNDVDYASRVHGIPGLEQASFHTRRDWPPLIDVALAAVGEEPISTTYQGRNLSTDELEKAVERYTQKL